MDAWQDDEGNFHFKPRRVEFLSNDAYLRAVCAEHAAGEARAAPEPWAAEAMELDRRGLRREHE